MSEVPRPPRPEVIRKIFRSKPDAEKHRAAGERKRPIQSVQDNEDSFRTRALISIRDRLKSLTKKDKKKDPITNPIARFNLGLDGQSIDDKGRFGEWKLTEEAAVALGLPQEQSHEPSEKLKAELAAPEKISDPETGQKFNTLRLNWDQRKAKPSQPVLVVFSQFTDEINKGAPHYRIAEIARQSGVATLAIDHPSMGDSDKLTREQRATMGAEGYRAIAQAELRIIKKLGITQIDLSGSSMGALAAVEVANVAAEQFEDYGITVRNLMIAEAPGAEQFSLVEIGKRFGATKEYVDTYANNPRDPRQLEASGGGSFGLGEQVKLAGESLRLDALRYARAMGQETLRENLRRALLKNKNLRVHDIHGMLSGISPAQRNKEMITGLKTAFGDRVRRIAFSGEPHTLMESGKRYGALVNLILRQSSGKMR